MSQTVSVSTTPGKITVPNRIIIAGKIGYYNTHESLPDVTLALSGDLTQTSSSSSDGTYSFTVPSGGNYDLSPQKDSNSPPSQGITTLDISLIRRHILGIAQLDSVHKIIAADVNGSQSITTLDISLIRRVILGITDTFPAGLWKFVPADQVFADPNNPWPVPEKRHHSAPVTDQTGQDFVAIKLGDVNNSWTKATTARSELASDDTTNPGSESRVRLASIQPDTVTSVTFTVGDVTVPANGSVNLPVTVAGFTKVTTAQCTIQWDPKILTFAGTANYGLNGLTGGSFGTTQVANGILTLSWDDPDAIGVTVPDGTAILNVQFTAIGTNGTSSTVAFADVPTVREVTVNFTGANFVSHSGTAQIGTGRQSPAIAQQPQSQTVLLGSSVNLTVSATGSAPLAFQWKFNGALLPGATSPTLTIGSAHKSDEGRYQVVVTNAAGTITSQEAVLAVNSPPVVNISSPVANATYTAPASITITANATDVDDQIVKVEFFQGETKLAEATRAPFSYSWANVPTGSYLLRARATDNRGAVTSSDAVSITVGPVIATNTPPRISVIADQVTTVGTVTSPIPFTVADGETPAEKLIISGSSSNKILVPELSILFSGAGSNRTVVVVPAPNQSGTATITITVSDGSLTTSTNFLLTVNGPKAIPVITAQPQSQTTNTGSSVSFSVTASGGSPLGYQWQKNGINITGATSATLAISSVQASDAGKYRVIVSNSVTSVTSQEALLTVLLNSFVQRHLPAGYVPGVALTVTLLVTPPTTSSSHVVEDQPPSGWTISNISNGGSWDTVNSMVKFGPFFDASSKTLTYQATSPNTATGLQTFAGIASVDGLNSPISGDPSIQPAQFHPADNNPADWRISANEITAYGAAWKKGEAWLIEPNPIPPDYVSRAGALWKGGEVYKIDTAAASAAPLWWVNVSSKPQSVSLRAGLALNTIASGSTATSSLPEMHAAGVALTVSITISPAASVVAYVVEDQPPVGWSVSNINESGSFDPNNRKVKWGPFFDNTPRTLTYDVTPPVGSSGTAAFSGLASFDGADLAISGQRSTTLGPPAKTTPTITWAKPGDIVYGATLTEAQLNAQATVAGNKIAGSFVYDPVFGTALNAGTSQTLKAAFTPADLSLYTSATAQVQINVLKADQTIAFAKLPSKFYGDAPFILGASASSGLPVTFVAVSGPASLNGTLLSLTGVGPVTIRADQAGNDNFNPAPAVEITFMVGVGLKELKVGNDGSFSFKFEGVRGRTYLIEGSNDLQNWEVLKAFTNVTGPLSFQELLTNKHSARFYRTRELP